MSNAFTVDSVNLKYYNMINDKAVKDFVMESFNLHPSQEVFDEKLKDANGVAEWLIFLLKDDKILSEGANAYFVDLLIAAALIHNLDYSYNEEDWTKIFNPRKLTTEIALEKGLVGNTMDAIYQAVEGQLGKDNPNKLLHPNPNSPTAHFALACSIYYKKIKK